jgi:hypothetical protein
MPTEESVPETLYHYCSAESFLRIIETQSIHLSSVLGFNDYLETKWIEPLIRDAIQSKAGAQNAAFLDTVMHHYHDNQTIPFMTCFSSDGDTLSQWRAYAADGYGFAIGMNPRYFPLRKQAPWVSEEEEHAIGISEVVYDRAAQSAYIAQAIDSHLACFNADGLHSLSHHAAECATVLLRDSLIFKNPKFNEELEWRIIYVPTIIAEEGAEIQIGLEQRPISDLRFRDSEDALIPYFELSFSEQRGEKAINEIVLGPKNNTQAFVVRMLLDMNGFGDVKISKSEASYR